MDRRRKMGGFKIEADLWIYTKIVLTEWRKPTPEMQEYLKRRMLSIMLCVSWVCAGAFDDREWWFGSQNASQATFRNSVCVGRSHCMDARGRLLHEIPRGFASAPHRTSRSPCFEQLSLVAERQMNNLHLLNIIKHAVLLFHPHRVSIGIQ